MQYSQKVHKIVMRHIWKIIDLHETINRTRQNVKKTSKINVKQLT